MAGGETGRGNAEAVAAARAGLLQNPRLWLAGVVAWFLVLFLMSSFSGTNEEMPKIPHFDKVAHFGYFFGGGGLLAAYLYFLRPAGLPWRFVIGGVMVTMGLIGLLDEWHQTFTPGRSGNDPYDWLADILGATSGALVFKLVHRWLK